MTDTETQHTPGPWMTRETPNGHTEVTDGLGAVSITHTVRSNSGAFSEEARANARLIAAAPTLYAALEDNIDAIENAFQAAVNRAEGDSDVVGRLNRIKAELRDALAKAEGRDE